MAKVLIYNRYLGGVGGVQVAHVYRDTDNYNIVTSEVGFISDVPILPADNDPVGTPVCYGYDKIQYKAQSVAPYAYATVAEYNSPFCDFPTAVCDIAFFGTPIVTHETAPSANDGSIQVYAQSSRTNDIEYKVVGLVSGYEDTTATGKFYNLQPDTYNVIAYEQTDISCAVSQQVVINEYDPNFTTYKYRIQFDTIQGRNVEIKLIDTNNLYHISEYPKDIKGFSGEPQGYAKKLASEDKTERFAVTTLTMNLYNDGTFTVDEFARSPEESWRCEMYYDGVLEFQGYLLPDEVKDEYKDPNYPVQLLATDGLPSLKGKEFSDLSEYINDDNGDPVYKKLYGLKKWGYLMKICLEHLGYDYGEVMLVNSLQYNLTYNVDLWIDTAIWGDIFYNENDEPVSVYEALEILLSSFNLCIVQHKGSFVLINWNDLYYINKPAKADLYRDAFWRFSRDFTYLISYGPIIGSNPVERPPLLTIGKNQQLLPIGDSGDVSYDQSFGVMEAKVDFDILALYYPDPSFEYGQNIGNIPIGWVKVGDFDISITDEQAYDGFNSLKIHDDTDPVIGSNTNYLKYEFIVDENNKKLNFSFFWLPVYVNDNETANPLYQIQLIGDNGKQYRYLTGRDDPANNGWFEVTDIDDDEGVNAPNQNVTDFQAWNKYDVVTTTMPSSGTVRFTFKHPAGNLVDPNGDEEPPGYIYTVYVDLVNITTSDANDSYTFQTGEIHRVTNFTQYSNAQKKTIDLPLFTYPNNKRLAGNVFTDDDYLIGEVRNLYTFALSPDTPAVSRLPEAVIKAVARNYQRPMYKYDGNIKGDNIQFYALFSILTYDAVFMPFSIETDLRNSVSRVVLCELEDGLAQARYNYIPTYEKNARKNTS